MATSYATPAEAGVEVGSIFYSSWGYDQTNVDFYEVVALTPKGVKVKGIGKEYLPTSHPSSDSVVPKPGSFNKDSKPDQKRLQVWGEGDRRTVSFNLTSYSSGYLWDGTPKYQTGHGYGH